MNKNRLKKLELGLPVLNIILPHRLNLGSSYFESGSTAWLLRLVCFRLACRQIVVSINFILHMLYLVSYFLGFYDMLLFLISFSLSRLYVSEKITLCLLVVILWIWMEIIHFDRDIIFPSE